MAVLFMLTAAITTMLIFKNQIENVVSQMDVLTTKEYDSYYVMIVGDQSSSFWKSVYQSAKAAGEEENALVELMGDELASTFSKEELMQIAIASKVDGIFLEADESASLTSLIDEAVMQGIPVITVLGDNTASNRLSFVGVNNYNLGKMYGKQVLELADGKDCNVLVLMSNNTEDWGQNILYASIYETMKTVENSIHMRSIKIEEDNAFAAEESIRDIFVKEASIPDILICLNELNTTCAYQAVVDYNKVGDVNILGYYDSDVIIKAVERNVIYSTIKVNTEQIGRYLIEAMKEYQMTGHANEYYTVDTALIISDNLKEFTTGGRDGKEE
jgi:ribose transport system substrate-binding protein